MVNHMAALQCFFFFLEHKEAHSIHSNLTKVSHIVISNLKS